MPTETTDRALAADRICDAARDGELHVVSAMFPNQADALLAELLAATGRRGLRLRLYTADLSGKYRFVEGAVVPDHAFVTIGGRVPSRFAGQADFLPMSLFEVTRAFLDKAIRVDAFVGQVAPPDADGHCSFGPVIAYSLAALHAADTVVLEINEGILPMPGNPGPHLDTADVVVRAGAVEVGELPMAPPGEVEDVIGEHLATLIPNSATIQCGIGGIPESFLRRLASHKDLRIHSGAIPEAAVELLEAGVFSDDHPHITTSLLGTRRLYEYAADPAHHIELHPVDVTHGPRQLIDVPDLYAVNSAFEVDLTGQVNAEYAQGKKRASAGGQSDFARWAHISGANILAIRSMSRLGESSIVPLLSAPHAVTTQRGDVDFVVTEFGIADLRARTAGERRDRLISIAHPSQRSNLTADSRGKRSE